MRQPCVLAAFEALEILPGGDIGGQTERMQRHMRTDGQIRQIATKRTLYGLLEVLLGDALKRGQNYAGWRHIIRLESRHQARQSRH